MQAREHDIEEIYEVIDEITICRVAVAELHTIDETYDICWDSGYAMQPQRVYIYKLYLFQSVEYKDGDKLIKFVTFDNKLHKEIAKRHYLALLKYCNKHAIQTVFHEESVHAYINSLTEESA